MRRESRKKNCFSHQPKATWPKCAGCGRSAETLVDGKCAACLDPVTYALCQRVDEEERKWRTGTGGPISLNLREMDRAALLAYQRRVRRLPDPSIVSLMLDHTSANSGKRGGPKGGER